DAHAPLHAAGVTLELAAGHVGDTDHVEQLRHTRTACGALTYALENGDVVQELAGTEVRVDAELLGQIAEYAPDTRAPALDGRIVLTDADGAARRVQDASQDAHEGGLAGAVGSEQPKHAACDGEVYSAERADVADVDFGEALRDDAHG